MEYLINVSASIVGGILLLWGMALFSKQAKEIFTLILARWLDFDLMYVFKDKKDTNLDLQVEIEKATFVFVLTVRGNDFQQDTFLPLFDGKHEFNEIKILLPNNASKGFDWFQQREIELQKFDSAFGFGVLKKQTATNIEYLKNHVHSQKIQLRLYLYPFIGRIVITDRCLFFTPMQRDSYIRRNKTFKYASGGDMYRHYLRLFDQLWIASELPK